MLGQIVHYVAEDYECPAMVVGTSAHFDDPDDVSLQYGDDFQPASRMAITIVVHHPWTRQVREVDTDEIVEIPVTELVVDPLVDSTGEIVGSYHTPDQCSVT